MTLISLSLVGRCDACLWIGGPSNGVDDEVGRFEVAGRPVYRVLGDLAAAS